MTCNSKLKKKLKFPTDYSSDDESEFHWHTTEILALGIIEKFHHRKVVFFQKRFFQKSCIGAFSIRGAPFYPMAFSICMYNIFFNIFSITIFFLTGGNERNPNFLWEHLGEEQRSCMPYSVETIYLRKKHKNVKIQLFFLRG